ncbi:MAG: hypothetical protein WC249_00170 [Patescibacteria group bacterium]|jgi:hypothetical protein
MKNLITLDYWFNLRPEALLPSTQNAFMALVISLAILALIIAVTKNRGGIYRGFLNRLYSFCLTNAAIGLLLLFFNYEVIPFFSARFWLGFWALLMLIWLIFILKKFKNIPIKKKKLEEEKELKKYLP